MPLQSFLVCPVPRTVVTPGCGAQGNSSVEVLDSVFSANAAINNGLAVVQLSGPIALGGVQALLPTGLALQLEGGALQVRVSVCLSSHGVIGANFSRRRPPVARRQRPVLPTGLLRAGGRHGHDRIGVLCGVPGSILCVPQAEACRSGGSTH